ncbi:MAG TPA: glycosyltransferase family 2 protein [Puia sp.]|nr:glycosyltransferase family 2 protein [Puia sp.]
MYEIGQPMGAGTPIRRTPKYTKPQSVQRPIHRLSIIIPCYNEASTISIILDKINDVELYCSVKKEIIVINDCSTDDTDLMISEFIEEHPEAGIIYKVHAQNGGKGCAIQTGLAAATGEYVLIQDADLEYDPKEYNLLLEPVLSGHADVVYGSRFMGGQPHRILFFWHTIGNKVLTFISNLFTNMNLTDAHTCYKVVPLNILKNIPLLEKRFAFDAELNVKLSYIPGVRIYEVGISYYGRTFSEGKKIRMGDAFRTIYCLIKYTFFSSTVSLKTIQLSVPSN